MASSYALLRAVIPAVPQINLLLSSPNWNEPWHKGKDLELVDVV